MFGVNKDNKIDNPFPFRKRYIFKNLGYGIRFLKWRYQRAMRGYSDCDVWNMDSYLYKILPNMLNQLADTTSGYPGRYSKEYGEYYPALEKLLTDKDKVEGEELGYTYWKKELKDLAELIKKSNPDDEAYDSEDRKKWDDIMAFYEELKERRKKAFIHLAEIFPDLWD